MHIFLSWLCIPISVVLIILVNCDLRTVTVFSAITNNTLILFIGASFARKTDQIMFFVFVFISFLQLQDWSWRCMHCFFFIQKWGDLDHVTVIRDRSTGESKGFGYVKYHRPYHAALAFENCNQSEHHNLLTTNLLILKVDFDCDTDGTNKRSNLVNREWQKVFLVNVSWCELV